MPTRFAQRELFYNYEEEVLKEAERFVSAQISDILPEGAQVNLDMTVAEAAHVFDLKVRQ